MSIANWNAGIIRPVAVAPTGPYEDSAAPGMWTLDQAAYWRKQGLWPTFGNIDPSAFIESLFSTYLYTGNGATQTITNGIDLAGEGGLVWTKTRSNAGYAHRLSDTARGIYQTLYTNAADAQTTETSYLTAFNSNGFALGSTNNLSGQTYASWTFRKQPKFFDIVTYTGDGANRTISHNLGSAPGCLIVKRTDAAGDWQLYHIGLASAAYSIEFNLGNVQSLAPTVWNSTAPTSTVFSVGTNPTVNASGGTYVAYLFASNAGGFGLTGTDNVITCGSYIGNGSSIGPSIDLGYEPQWLMMRKIDGSGLFTIQDNMRGLGTSGSIATYLMPANTSAGVSGAFLSATATGFQVVTDDSYYNTNGAPYIYVAIRRGPMAVPTLGTSVFKAIARTGTGGATDITGVGFSPDLVHTQTRDSYGANGMFDRLRGAPGQLRPASTVAEQTTTDIAGYLMDGVATGGSVAYINDSGIPYINHFFRRAPSFFDEVCYTGTGSAQTLTHNLGVVPELLIFKNRTNTGGFGWYTFSPAHMSAPSTTPYWNYLQLQSTAAAGDWGNNSAIAATPTSSTISIGSSAALSIASNTNVLYLFATCAGVSKVGSYTGTGTTQAINCGFTTGARFVMIKRTDSTGDWYYWDSARGIVAGNDPYLLMNTTTAEVTNTDYVDTSAAGFEISSTAPAAINANGGSYIFLAVA